MIPLYMLDTESKIHVAPDTETWAEWMEGFSHLRIAVEERQGVMVRANILCKLFFGRPQNAL